MDANILFQEREVQLRDGRRVLLRQACPRDGELFCGFYDGLSAKSRDFMHGWSGLDPEKHGQTLALKTRTSDHFAIVVVSYGRIAGYCWIDGVQTQDVPMLGIGIIDEFHETGLGKMLLRTMLEYSANMGIPTIWLGVWTDNSRAMHVYGKIGFRDYPLKPARDFSGRTELYMIADTGFKGERRPRQFPLIELSGTYYEIGKQHGTLLRGVIDGSLVFMREILPVPVDIVIEYAKKSIPYCVKHAPELIEEIQGIADGSGHTLEEIFALNASLDIIGSVNRNPPVSPFIKGGMKGGLNIGHDCWTMALNTEITLDDKTFVTWTAEDNPGWLDKCVLLKILHEKDIPCLLWTFAGFVGRPGINPYLALSAACIISDDCDDGMPYPLLCRKILMCRTTEEAIRIIDGYDRMSGMGYTIGDNAGSIATLETSARNALRKEKKIGWTACAGRWTEERISRIEQLIREKSGRIDFESIAEIMKDHGQGNLCSHDSEAIVTLTTLISDVKDRVLWVSYGSPCRNGYVRHKIQI